MNFILLLILLVVNVGVFFRLLCAFRGKYYSEEVDEQQDINDESVASVNETEETEDTANSLVQNGVASKIGEKDSMNSVVGEASSAVEEHLINRPSFVSAVSEVPEVGDSSAPDTVSPEHDDTAEGWDDAGNEMYVGRHAHADFSTSFLSTRAVFNLDSNTFPSTMPAGSFGRCFIEVWATFCFLKWTH